MPQAKANSISRHLYSSFKSVSFIVLPIITFLLAACDFNKSPTITNLPQKFLLLEGFSLRLMKEKWRPFSVTTIAPNRVIIGYLGHPLISKIAHS